MALEDKTSGQKWFAFELNNILKYLRQLSANILKLNDALHWDYLSTQAITGSGTATSITATLAMPVDANFAVLQVTASGGQPEMISQLIIGRNGITAPVNKQSALYSGSNYRQISASITGNVITITHTYYTSTALTLSGNAYYFT
jgi:hypothetical protein